MLQRHAGGKTQSLLCAPAPPSYTERFPTSLQPAPHQTHPEGSDAPGHPQAPRLSVPDASRRRDAQGRRRGGGCGSVTVLPGTGRACGPPPPPPSRKGPGDAQPDPDSMRRLQPAGSGGWTRPMAAARGCSAPGPAAPRSGPSRSRTPPGRPTARPGGVSSADGGHRSPESPAEARPARAAGAGRGPGRRGLVPLPARRSRPDAAVPGGAALPGSPLPPRDAAETKHRPRCGPGARGFVCRGRAPAARPARCRYRFGARARCRPARYLLARRGARRGLPARSMVLPAAARPRRARAGGAAAAGPPRAARALKRQRPRKARTPPAAAPDPRRDGPGVPVASPAGPSAPPSHVPIGSSGAPQPSPAHDAPTSVPGVTQPQLHPPSLSQCPVFPPRQPRAPRPRPHIQLQCPPVQPMNPHPCPWCPSAQHHPSLSSRPPPESPNPDSCPHRQHQCPPLQTAKWLQHPPSSPEGTTSHCVSHGGLCPCPAPRGAGVAASRGPSSCEGTCAETALHFINQKAYFCLFFSLSCIRAGAASQAAGDTGNTFASSAATGREG